MPETLAHELSIVIFFFRVCVCLNTKLTFVLEVSQKITQWEYQKK